MFGVTLDTPREIRTEEAAQGRQISFAFAGFSGYTVLLLLLVCYKEFGISCHLLPTWKIEDLTKKCDCLLHGCLLQ